MLKLDKIEQIKTDYKNGISLRKIAARHSVALQTVFKITRTLIKTPTEKKSTIKEKNIYIYSNKDSNKDIYINTKEKDISALNTENNISTDINSKANTDKTVFTPILNKDNKQEDSKQLKVINSSINKILKELKNVDYQKEKLKDLASSLNALNKQRQDITGSVTDNQSILQQIFNSPEQVKALLQEIRQSKADPEGYIIKQAMQAEQ